MRRLRAHFLLLLVMLLPTATLAAPPISLLADSIYIDQSSGSLVATGNVQVFFEGTTLTATEIRYDPNGAGITATGPLTIFDANDQAILADFAQLSADLKSGLIRGAKLLFDDQLQIVATEAERSAGRFNTLNNVVASACQVCITRPVPVWKIRSRQVVHDTEKRQIHFYNATLDVFGVPIVYLPYMRIPEPGVRRASGFLTPVFLSSNYFGGGLKLPYYIVLGKHADITITPTVSFSGVQVLDVEYRQNFRNGSIKTFAAIAIRDEYGNAGRGFLKTNGSFNILSDVTLAFDITLPTDNGFLNQYKYDRTDRLISEVSLSRYRNRSFFSLASAVMTSLRDDDNDLEIPFVLPELSYRGYRTDPILGGKIGYDINTLGLFRRSGQDMIRMGGGVDWYVPVDLPSGFRAAGIAAIEADIYRVWNSDIFPSHLIGALYPSVGAEIRWPLARTTENFRHVFEPTAQLVYTADPAFNQRVPNEDSLQVEFDETNLFDLNRFPGRDVSETGFRANIGATYTVYANEGWSLGLAAGLVLRSEPSAQFPENSLIGGSQSDILGAINFDYAPNFNVQGRFLFDDQLDFKRSETQFSFDFDRVKVNGTLLYLAPDILALSSRERGEGRIAGRYRFADNWEVDMNWQRDLLEDRNVSAGIGLTYGNECIEVGVSLSRKFTNSSSVTPATDFDVKIQLAGFGGSSDNNWPAARCVK